jgi:predicted dienelactone hydrolase
VDRGKLVSVVTPVVASSSLCVALAFLASAWSLPPEPNAFDLPAPTGPAPVGTARWVVIDSSRSDPFDPGHPREIEVIAWYPAAARRSPSPPAPYLRAGLDSVRSFASRLGRADLLDDLAQVRTHATLDAAPASTTARLPVLIFNHGYTGPAEASTSLLEDLASHGFAVLSVVHSYEASAARLADGRVVTILDATGKLRGPIQEILDEWQTEDARMADVTNARNREEQLRILRAYLGGLHRTSEALKRWVDDVRAVVDDLPNVSDGTVRRVVQRLDATRFGVFGHSMGGVTAGEFCLDEKRCAAALNLDGIPQYGSMIDRELKRPFLMVYSARPGRLGASDAIYQKSGSPYYRVDVEGTLHVDFSDMTFWPVLRARHITGPLDPTHASDATRAIVREFFDQTLLGRRSALLSGSRVLAGVRVTRP